MAVTANQVVWRYTNVNTAQVGAAATSLGKYPTSGTITSGGNNLFNDISAANNNNSTYYYRCIILHNSNTIDTLTNITVSIAGSETVTGAAEWAIGLDPSYGSLTYSTSTITSQNIANETTAPTVAPTWGASTAQFTLTGNQCRAIWVRIQGNNTAASSETLTISWTGTA